MTKLKDFKPLLFRAIFIYVVLIIFKIAFSFSWDSNISVLWIKLGFDDSYVMDCFEAFRVILLVLMTSLEPFLWTKERVQVIKVNFPSNRKKALIMYGVFVLTHFLVLATRNETDFTEIIKSYSSYIQILYYFIISLALVLFCCGLSYRAFKEETKVHFLIYSIIISLVSSAYLYLYTGSIITFIFQFILQFSTLLVFNLYPSIWCSMAYETVMMFLTYLQTL